MRIAFTKLRGAWPVAAVFAALAFVSPALGAQSRSRPNVVLVTIDTLRADRLKCYGYTKVQTPAIDRLAAEGVRFKTVVTQVPLTLPSHCTILTGTYPAWHGVRDNVGYKLPESKTTLAEILKPHGYETAAFIGAYVLNAKFGLSQGFDYYDDRIAGPRRPGPVVNLNAVERPAGEVVSRASAWLDAHFQSPFFVWIHLYDPHDPYEPPAPFKARYKEDPYDGEIAYADQELGKFLEFLRHKGVYDNTVIVLTSDHGESFGEHQEWTHGYFIYDTTLLVPLIIKPIEKGLAGSVVAQQVSLVDVVPTILQLLRVERPGDLQGRGMLGLMRGQSRDWPALAYCETYYPAQFGWSPLAGVRREDVKFIRAPKPELYDLREDPGEQTNRVLQQGALAAALKASLSRLESTYSLGKPDRSARVELNSQQLDELRALGYVGISTPHGPGVMPEGVADPKDKRAVYHAISSAGQDVAAGRYREAVPALEKVLRLEPGMRIALSMLGRSDFELGRFGAAKSAFREILRQQPQNVDAQFYVAACDYREKNWAEAQAGLQQVLRQDPGFTAAHLYLGFLHQARGDPDSALASFRHVIELDADNEDAHAKAGFLLASRGEVMQAVPHFQKVIELDPGDAEAHSNLGVAYIKLGRTEMARKELAEACRLDRKYCR